MQRAILFQITDCNYSTNEEPEKFTMMIIVCYQDTITREDNKRQLDVVIDTSITAPFVGPQLRDVIKNNQPPGYSLSNGDIYMFSFSKGNAL